MYRIHIYGNPSVPSTIKLTSDAFTQTAFKYAKEFKKLGHHVIVYGTLEFKNEFICDEFVSINSLKDFDSETLSEKEIVEKFSNGPYLSNLISSEEIDKKYKIIYKTRSNFQNHLNARTVHLNDIFLVFWDLYDMESFSKIESLGGIVIEGLCQYGTVLQTPKFKYSVFASASEHKLRVSFQNTIGKYAIIPPFFDPSDFNFSANKIKDTYLYLGRLQECKGFWIIIQLAKCFKDKTFWVAGQARIDKNFLEYQTYDQTMKWLDLSETPNLIYKGLADKELRKELLSKASILIQPSMYDEPFGWNIIEANLSGTPVITSDRGAFLETVTNGINGYRLNPISSYEKWREIFDKTSEISPQRCYDHVESKYTPERIMDAYTKFIHGIIN